MNSQPADQLLRFAASQRLLRHVLGDAPATVLDVGGYPGTFATFLRAAGDPWRIATADVVPAEIEAYHQIRDGILPFEAGAVDAVVTNDTLEHVPPSRRAPFLAELFRVARRVVVVAAPSAHAATSAVEARLDALHRRLLGTPHPWLEEHLRHGLPDPAATLDAGAAAGWGLVAMEANAPLDQWLLWQAAHIARSASLAVEAAFARWDAHCSGAAQEPPPTGIMAYRHVLALVKGVPHEGSLAQVLRHHASRADAEAQRAEALMELVAALAAAGTAAGPGSSLAASVDARLIAALEDAEQRLRQREGRRALLRRFFRGGSA